MAGNGGSQTMVPHTGTRYSGSQSMFLVLFIVCNMSPGMRLYYLFLNENKFVV